MSALLLGLIIFLGVHSTRIVAPDWREAQRARWGVNGWKGIISVLSAISLALLVWGYGETRLAPHVLWNPPLWTRHLASLLTLPAFILLVAAYVPGNRIKTAIGHPMTLSVKSWALAHLLANGNLADVLLFGSFLVWAALSFRTGRQLDRTAGTIYPSGPASRTLITIAIGVAVWLLFAKFLHLPLIGVAPFG